MTTITRPAAPARAALVVAGVAVLVGQRIAPATAVARE